MDVTDRAYKEKQGILRATMARRDISTPSSRVQAIVHCVVVMMQCFVCAF